VEAFSAGGSAWSQVVTGRTWSAVEQWRMERMGAREATGDSADDGDPDEDRIPNLVEYALGLDPMETNDVGGIMNVRVREPITIAGEGYGTLTYDLYPDAADDVEIVVEISTGLIQTDAWPREMIPVREETIGDVVRVWLRSPTPLNAQQAEFYRLRVVRP
jgi:hypothetical protein